MSTIHLDDIKQDYEQKIANLEKQLKTQISSQKDDFEKEIVI